mmetsp:Transcript_28829/g.56617  ORF Transcript_28829/g.56617 Transcript_28829/m.56617 type:complete len:328 (-) Transcript_28829:321-1304(-)
MEPGRVHNHHHLCPGLVFQLSKGLVDSPERHINPANVCGLVPRFEQCSSVVWKVADDVHGKFKSPSFAPHLLLRDILEAALVPVFLDLAGELPLFLHSYILLDHTFANNLDIWVLQHFQTCGKFCIYYPVEFKKSGLRPIFPCLEGTSNTLIDGSELLAIFVGWVRYEEHCKFFIFDEFVVVVFIDCDYRGVEHPIGARNLFDQCIGLFGGDCRREGVHFLVLPQHHHGKPVDPVFSKVVCFNAGVEGCNCDGKPLLLHFGCNLVEMRFEVFAPFAPSSGELHQQQVVLNDGLLDCRIFEDQNAVVKLFLVDDLHFSLFLFCFFFFL